MELYSSDGATESTDKASRPERFVGYVIERIKKDTGFAARLRRADNPATEYQSWELLAGFGIDLENEWERLPYCTVGAALAKAKPLSDGRLPLGAAVASCYKEGNQSDQAKARLRRLLACTTSTEVCLILRPLLALMANRGVTLDFSKLLAELLRFSGSSHDRIRARWAQGFYHHAEEASGIDAGAAND